MLRNIVRRSNHKLAILAALVAWLSIASTSAFGQEWRPGGTLVLEGNVVTMNDRAEVLAGARVVIQADRIVAVVPANAALPASAAAAPVVKVAGFIFPGLIDAHNHLEYDTIPMWSVPKLYHDMYEWMDASIYEKEIKYPKKLLSDPDLLGLQGELGKYGEVKAISGGTTSLQGSPANGAYTSHLVRNIEFSNFGTADRITQRSVGIMSPYWQNTGALDLKAKIAANKIDAWLVHLAEGTDEKARVEFDVLQAIGLAVSQTAIIHGIALGDRELTIMGQRGMKLISSPLDNYLLYGKTADLPLAARRGVLVSLGSDWSPFGSKNLLTELKVAAELNRSTWNNAFSELDLVRMVTTNPARTLKLESKIGTVASGLFADLLVLESSEANPYRALIAATEANVKLVLVGGEPYYGDADVMQRLKGTDQETIGVANGRVKAVDVTRAGVTKGTQTFGEIRSALESALRVDTAWLAGRLPGTAGFSDAQVRAVLAREFPMGIGSWVLDPVFAGADAHYFQVIRASTNAAFPFDIERYWRVAATPPVVTPPVVTPPVVTPPVVTRTATIASVPVGRAALVRASAPSGAERARLQNGDRVTILSEQRLSANSLWYEVQTAAGVRGFVSSIYCRMN